MVEATGRINKFDNLKGLAILLIVMGHLTFFRKFEAISFIRDFVFLFHLPVFFFVAGYFSKIGPDEPIKAFKRLVIPYILFCLIWEIFNVYYLGNSPKSALFIHPGYILWFLMALFFMKILLPIVDKFRYPLIIAIIASLLIGFINSNILGISRTFIYMPIFILGFYYDDYKEKFINKFPIIENNKFAVIVLILTLLLSILITLTFNYDVVSMKHTYGHDFLRDMLVRGMVILVSAINVLVLTRFMTNKKIVLTQFGIDSLTVYLLHPYAIKLAKKIFAPYLKGHQKLIVAFVLMGSFIIVWLLSRDIVSKALNKLFSLINNILFE